MSLTAIGLSSAQRVRQSGQLGSATSQLAAVSGNAPRTDSATLSSTAQLVRRLQELQQSDPDRFKALMSTTADKLKSAAAAAQDPAAKTQLTDLASAFEQAGETGDVSALSERTSAASRGAPPPGGGARPAAGSGNAGSSKSSSSLDPADTNLDGTVSEKERLAYEQRLAESKAALQQAQARNAYAASPGSANALASNWSLLASALGL